MIYRFYHSQVAEHGLQAVGEAEATLVLTPLAGPKWEEVSDHFRSLCLPWFEETTRFDVADSLEELEPYSEEALRYLSKVKLPSLGYVMVEAGEA